MGQEQTDEMEGSQQDWGSSRFERIDDLIHRAINTDQTILIRLELLEKALSQKGQDEHVRELKGIADRVMENGETMRMIRSLLGLEESED